MPCSIIANLANQLTVMAFEQELESRVIDQRLIEAIYVMRYFTRKREHCNAKV